MDKGGMAFWLIIVATMSFVIGCETGIKLQQSGWIPNSQERSDGG